MLRDHAIFLCRHGTPSRSNCESKCDVRLEQYFRVYDERGDLSRQKKLPDRLDACLLGEGGYIRQNYKDPKDPRKTGIWSGTVQSRPLRVQMPVDTDVPMLVGRVRVLRGYVRCLGPMGWMEKIPQRRVLVALQGRCSGVGRKATPVPSNVNRHDSGKESSRRWSAGNEGGRRESAGHADGNARRK